MSTWQPMAEYPIRMPVHPDAAVYLVAVLLSIVSGFLFGAVPVKQVLQTNPYEVVKGGSSAAVTRRMGTRDVLLVVQIVICAVLVTSSMVAIRGLLRTMHSSFGFEPRNAILVDTVLSMAGYSGDQFPQMQKKMIDALESIPGVERVGLIDQPPLSGTWTPSNVFTDKTTDLRPANAAADAIQYKISPEYFQAARTALLSGRALTWHDDKNAPLVAVVNDEFARRLYGSVENSVGQYFKMPDGRRIQIVGIVEQGKHTNIAEIPHPALFLPILQSPSPQTWLIVRSQRDPQQISAAVKSTLQRLDPGLPVFLQTWSSKLNDAMFGARAATTALGVLGVLGAMLAITGIFGMAAYSVSKRLKELGIRIALGARREEILHTVLARAFKLLAFGSVVGLLLGILASRVLSFIVYLGTPRDPLVLVGAVLTMAMLGLLATWIPAQRALKIDPLRLLREE